MDTENALSVSEINELIKTIITENLDQKIFVKGEISNIKKSNGNLYFSLKDEGAMINIIYWRPKFGEYNNGDNVIVSGKVTCFSKQGTYQITVQSIEKSGLGDLYKKYDKLKESMNTKSYFSKKREFPTKINRIAILTSTEGAALQDIMYVLHENNYRGEVYVKNCIVQGNGCPISVKNGIEYFNRLNDQKPIDILIVARGGGSIEDLMGYSSEEVVKAIYLSKIFTISAIGHEIDTMLSDLAADFRAPTPSIAGETIIKTQRKHIQEVNNCYEKIKQMRHSIESRINNYENKIQNLESIHKSSKPENLINNEIHRLENLLKNMNDKVIGNLHNIVYELEKIKNKNNMYNTSKILKSGYTIIINEKGDLIDSAETFQKNVKENKKLKIMFSDGTIDL
jgi:exodeoxyribonuclease VII large subunit